MLLYHLLNLIYLIIAAEPFYCQFGKVMQDCLLLLETAVTFP